MNVCMCLYIYTQNTIPASHASSKAPDFRNTVDDIARLDPAKCNIFTLWEKPQLGRTVLDHDLLVLPPLTEDHLCVYRRWRSEKGALLSEELVVRAALISAISRASELKLRKLPVLVHAVCHPAREKGLDSLSRHGNAHCAWACHKIAEKHPLLQQLFHLVLKSTVRLKVIEAWRRHSHNLCNDPFLITDENVRQVIPDIPEDSLVLSREWGAMIVPYVLPITLNPMTPLTILVLSREWGV